jgi:hypothetical protein
VRDRCRQLVDCLNDHPSDGQLPLYIWSKVRLFKLQKAEPEWNLMDTVGMGQLDAPDHEAFFESTAYEPSRLHAQAVLEVTGAKRLACKSRRR